MSWYAQEVNVIALTQHRGAWWHGTWRGARWVRRRGGGAGRHGRPQGAKLMGMARAWIGRGGHGI